VKLPSAEAESDTPGVENPFRREGLDAGGGMGGSTTVRARCSEIFGSEPFCSVEGVEPETKMRVNSPGPREGAGGATGLARGGGETGGLGRCSIARNICVNSPGALEAEPEEAGSNEIDAGLASADNGGDQSARVAPGPKAAGVPASDLATSGSEDAGEGVAPNEFKNIPVALSGSAWSRGSELKSFLVILSIVLFSAAALFTAKLTRPSIPA
jgi:hypothetical protein